MTPQQHCSPEQAAQALSDLHEMLGMEVPQILI